MRTSWRIALGLTLAVACTDSIVVPPRDRTDLREGALFQTDSLAYSLRSNPTGFASIIHVTFHNRSGSDAAFANCREAPTWYLEKLVGNSWQTAYSPFFLLCASVPIKVAAEATYPLPLYVLAGYPGSNVGPQFSDSSIAGTYRVVFFPQRVGGSDGVPYELLPLPDRISNSFTLSVQPKQ